MSSLQACRFTLGWSLEALFGEWLAGMSRVPQASAALQSADLPTDLKREAIGILGDPAYPAREELAALVLALKSSTLLQQALQGFLQEDAAGQGHFLQHHAAGFIRLEKAQFFSMLV